MNPLDRRLDQPHNRPERCIQEQTSCRCREYNPESLVLQSIAGIAGSNPVEGEDMLLLCLLCVV